MPSENFDKNYRLDDDLLDDAPGTGNDVPFNPNPITNPAGITPQANPSPAPAKSNEPKEGDDDILSRLNGIITGKPVEGGTEPQENDSLLDSILKQRGIDPNNIETVDENGKTQYVSFGELSREEQMDLMNGVMGNSGNNEEEDEDEPDDDEIDLINSIRNSRMSVEEFIEAIRQKAVSDYIQSNGGEREISVDDMTDDEIYVADFKNRVPDATVEDATQALENAKSNPDMYQRIVNGLRAGYKQQEEAYYQQKMMEDEQKVRAQQEKFENDIVDAINRNSEIKLGDLTFELEDDDKERIASAILDNDVSGNRYLARLLNDPDTLSEMVWYALQGKEAIDEMQRYYKRQITEKQAASYQKGYEDAKNGKGMSYVVQRPQQQRTKTQFHKIKTLDDLGEQYFD